MVETTATQRRHAVDRAGRLPQREAAPHILAELPDFQTPSGGIQLSPPLYHQDLARLDARSTETFGRFVRRLVAGGFLDKRSGRPTVPPGSRLLRRVPAGRTLAVAVATLATCVVLPGVLQSTTVEVRAASGLQEARSSIQVKDSPILATVTALPDGSGGAMLEIVLQNSTAKNISGYRLDLYAGGRLARSYWRDMHAASVVPGTAYFAPGLVERVQMTRRPGENQPDLRLGIVFEDRTAAGDETAVNGVFEWRARERNDLERWVGLTRKAVSTEAGLEGLNRLIRDGLASEDYRTALLSDLQTALRSSSDPTLRREAVNGTLRHYEKRLQAATEHAVRR